MTQSAHSAARLRELIIMAMLLMATAYGIFTMARSQGFSSQFWSSALSKGGGEAGSLATLPRDAKSLVVSANVTAFRVSEGIGGDADFFQRLSEFVYPVRVDPRAGQLLARKDEPVPSGCRIVAQSQFLSLHECNEHK